MTVRTILQALNHAVNESQSIHKRELYASAIEDFCYSQSCIADIVMSIKSLAIHLSSDRGIGAGTTIEDFCKEIEELLK